MKLRFKSCPDYLPENHRVVRYLARIGDFQVGVSCHEWYSTKRDLSKWNVTFRGLPVNYGPLKKPFKTAAEAKAAANAYFKPILPHLVKMVYVDVTKEVLLDT